MNFQNSGFLFREAVESDNSEILEILEENPFPGNISMIYTRREKPVESFRKESEFCRLIVAVDKNSSRIAGFGACVVHNCYIQGSVKKCGYLTGLRTREEYRKNIFLVCEAYREIKKVVEDFGVEICYTTIVEENSYAAKLFEKKRKIMPYYEKGGSYSVYSVKSGMKPRISRNYRFVKADQLSKEKIAEFYKKNSFEKQFYPEVTERMILENIDNSYGVVDLNGEISAYAVVKDIRDVKQNIVTSYSKLYRFIKFFNPLISIIGYPKLPEESRVLNYRTLSYWGVKKGEENAINFLIRNISAEYRKKTEFIVIGAESSSREFECIKKVKGVEYRSMLYIVDFEQKDGSAGFLKECCFYLECIKL